MSKKHKNQTNVKNHLGRINKVDSVCSPGKPMGGCSWPFSISGVWVVHGFWGPIAFSKNFPYLLKTYRLASNVKTFGWVFTIFVFNQMYLSRVGEWISGISIILDVVLSPNKSINISMFHWLLYVRSGILSSTSIITLSHLGTRLKFRRPGIQGSNQTLVLFPFPINLQQKFKKVFLRDCKLLQKCE